MTTRTLAVVSAGLGQPSSTSLLAQRLTAATVDALRDAGVDATVETVELREHAHALTDQLLTRFASDELQAVQDTVAGADGLIAVTPIFSASYTGLFKTFFDLLDDGALDGTPVLLGATAGTERHSLALDHGLRPLFAYLRAVPVPTGVFAASEDWGAGGEGTHRLGQRIVRAGEELAAAVAARPRRQVADPFGPDTSPLAGLLPPVRRQA